MLVSLSSCVYEYNGMEQEDPGIPYDQTILVLNVRSLDSGRSGAAPIELVKSLRIIIVNKGWESQEEDNESVEPTIELNKYYEFPANIPASGLEHSITWPTVNGPKSIYVIANEESIPYEESLIKGDVAFTSFSKFLNSFGENSDPANLVNTLQDYYYQPQFTETDDGSIYLPYTYYIDNVMPTPGQVTPVNAWLAPVATKFIFNFTNDREYSVNINGISMSFANKANYLFARVADTQQNLEFNGNLLYWPEWLAEISAESWNHTGSSSNEIFNNDNGWISQYYVPTPDDSHEYVFIAEGSGDTFNIPGRTVTDNGEEMPFSHTTDTYYIPESINFKNPESEVTDNGGSGSEVAEQTFYLTLLIEDTSLFTAPTFKNVAIPNLKALFRNTYVIVNVKFTDGDIDIYAEIAPWNEKTSNGWVSEGNAPSNNPFSKRKQ